MNVESVYQGSKPVVALPPSILTVLQLRECVLNKTKLFTGLIADIRLNSRCPLQLAGAGPMPSNQNAFLPSAKWCSTFCYKNVNHIIQSDSTKKTKTKFSFTQKYSCQMDVINHLCYDCR